MNSNPLPAAFALLGDQRNLAVESALLEALPHLEPAAQEAGLRLILKRGHPKGQSELVGRWQRLPDSLRSLLLERVSDLYAGIRVAVTSGEVDERLSAIDVIRQSGEGKLAYLLAGSP